MATANRLEMGCMKCACMSDLGIVFVHRGDRIIFLLLGGNKSSQSRDIKRAKAMAEEFDKE